MKLLYFISIFYNIMSISRNKYWYSARLIAVTYNHEIKYQLVSSRQASISMAKAIAHIMAISAHDMILEMKLARWEQMPYLSIANIFDARTPQIALKQTAEMGKEIADYITSIADENEHNKFHLSNDVIVAHLRRCAAKPPPIKALAIIQHGSFKLH